MHTALQIIDKEYEVSSSYTSSASLILDGNAMERAIRFANIMASGRATVPKHLQGNEGDCLAVTIQAMQWGMMPFSVAQKTHTVNGVLGYEAQLVNAVIIARAPVTGRIQYEWFGDWDRIAGRFKEIPSKNNPAEKRIVCDWTLKDEDGLGVEVWATFRGESDPRRLRLLLSQAAVRNSPLWGQDPKQQLAYLAVKRWSRLYCPDVILGVYTPDELEKAKVTQRDMGKAEVIEPQPSDDLMRLARTAAEQGMVAYQKFWIDSNKENRKLLADHHDDLKRIAIEIDEGKKSNAKHDEAIICISYSDVLGAINSAENVEALNTAADLIKSIANIDEQNELADEYHQKLGSLNHENN